MHKKLIVKAQNGYHNVALGGAATLGSGNTPPSQTVKDTSSGGGVKSPNSGASFNSQAFNQNMSMATGIGVGLAKQLLGGEVSNETNRYNQVFSDASNLLGQYKWIADLVAIGSELRYKFDPDHTTDQVTGEDQFFDSYFGPILPGGWVNMATIQKSSKLLPQTDEMLPDMGSGYGDIMDSYNKVKDLAGKKMGNALGQRDRANKKIHNVNLQLGKLLPIWEKTMQDQLLTSQMADRWNQQAENTMNGGFGNIYFGRLGFKMDILPKVHAILNKPKVVDTLTEWDIQEFKDGGKMNVIPEGALHARLHHMENAEGLTKKGIPVVSIAEGGEVEQQAEIELNEIIFNLDVTTELEKLMQDGSDNAAIEAGKLLVKEIFENTDDRTGLINELTNKESTPEEAVKNHKVFQQGGVLNTKTIEDLVDYAIQKSPTFVKRIGPNMGYAEFTDGNGRKQRGTHVLSYTTDNNKFVVFPQIQMREGKLEYIPNWKEAYGKARQDNNILEFDTEDDARNFSSNYKDSKQWKQYFDQWNRQYGMYKNGGIIEKIDKLSPEQIDKLTNFLKELEA